MPTNETKTILGYVEVEDDEQLPDYATSLRLPYLCGGCNTYVEYKQVKYTGLCFSCCSRYKQEQSGADDAERYL